MSSGHESRFLSLHALRFNVPLASRTAVRSAPSPFTRFECRCLPVTYRAFYLPAHCADALLSILTSPCAFVHHTSAWHIKLPREPHFTTRFEFRCALRLLIQFEFRCLPVAYRDFRLSAHDAFSLDSSFTAPYAFAFPHSIRVLLPLSRIALLVTSRVFEVGLLHR